MPDTGAPWNIPYVEPSDLVRDYPSDSEDLADAIADALDAAGGLVAVKHALFTGVQSASTAGGANFAVTDLSITHSLADAANKLVITASLGVAGSDSGLNTVGMAVLDGATFVGAGAADGSRSRVSTGARIGSGSTQTSTSQSFTFVYEPGDTTSRTYTVRAVNLSSATQVVFVNRNEGDGDGAQSPRGACALVIQEVKV
jgi:hypothetical protein